MQLKVYPDTRACQPTLVRRPGGRRSQGGLTSGSRNRRRPLRAGGAPSRWRLVRHSGTRRRDRGGEVGGEVGASGLVQVCHLSLTDGGRESRLKGEADGERVALRISFSDYPQCGPRQMARDRRDAVPAGHAVLCDRLEQLAMFRLSITAPPQLGVTKLVEAKIALGSVGLDLDELDKLIARALHELPMKVLMRAPPLCEVLSHNRGAHAPERLFSNLDVTGCQRRNRERHSEGLEQDPGRVDEFEVT